MANQNGLRIHEEIMLLALRDEEGTIASGTLYHFAIGGAVLAELLMSERIRVEDSAKKLVELTDSRPTGDPLIDSCLESIGNAKRRASLKTWVSRIANRRNLKHQVAEGLCRRGILREDVGKVLLVFSRRIYPELNPEPERKLLERLRKAIFTETRGLEPRTVVLVSLASGSGLLRVSFDKKKLKERKARIERICNGEMTGKATREAIQAMQTAVFIATIVPTIVTTTTIVHS